MNEALMALRSRLSSFCDDVGAYESIDNKNVPENLLYKTLMYKRWCEMHGLRFSQQKTGDIYSSIFRDDLEEAKRVDKLIGELNAESLETYANRNVNGRGVLTTGALLAEGVMIKFAKFVDIQAGPVDNRPRSGGGLCFSAVWKFLQDFLGQNQGAEYGNLRGRGPVNTPELAKRDLYPQTRPSDWAVLLNEDASKFGLTRLNIYDPRKAPPGSLIILNPFGRNKNQPVNQSTYDPKGAITGRFVGGYRTAHTSDPRAGDIAIMLENGWAQNDLYFQYPASPSASAAKWEPGNTYLAGVYAPAGTAR